MGIGLKRESQFVDHCQMRETQPYIAFYRLSDGRLDGKGATE
jgi:hypothetical protein